MAAPKMGVRGGGKLEVNEVEVVRIESQTAKFKAMIWR